MKTYESEQMFVESFAKDCKESLRNGQFFEAEVNNAVIVVSGMDNNNSSKVTIYQATVNGVSFQGSITALKKRLNITYTKEYKRSAEGTTRVTIKSDSELAETAKTAAERYIKAAALIAEYNKRYAITADNLDNIQSVILEALKQQRDKAAKERADKEAQQAAEAKRKAEAKRAELQRQLEALQKQLAEMQ